MRNKILLEENMTFFTRKSIIYTKLPIIDKISDYAIIKLRNSNWVMV